MPEVSEVEAVLTNVPENEQVRLALVYIGKYLELIHKDQGLGSDELVDE